MQIAYDADRSSDALIHITILSNSK